MAISPTEIRRLAEHGIKITWSDGLISELSSETLRKNCPCATCKEKRGDGSHSRPLTGKSSLLRVVESSKEEELRLEKIWGIGQYALGMLWGDGHQTGIYTFELLRSLSDPSSKTA